jgi:hypothetical protein
MSLPLTPPSTIKRKRKWNIDEALSRKQMAHLSHFNNSDVIVGRICSCRSKSKYNSNGDKTKFWILKIRDDQSMLDIISLKYDGFKVGQIAFFEIKDKIKNVMAIVNPCKVDISDVFRVYPSLKHQNIDDWFRSPLNMHLKPCQLSKVDTPHIVPLVRVNVTQILRSTNRSEIVLLDERRVKVTLCLFNEQIDFYDFDIGDLLLIYNARFSNRGLTLVNESFVERIAQSIHQSIHDKETFSFELLEWEPLMILTVKDIADLQSLEPFDCIIRNSNIVKSNERSCLVDDTGAIDVDASNVQFTGICSVHLRYTDHLEIVKIKHQETL